MAWILERLQEPSTWRGITMVMSAIGMHVSPDMAAEIAATGMGIAGALGALTSDKVANPPAPAPVKVVKKAVKKNVRSE